MAGKGDPGARAFARLGIKSVSANEQADERRGDCQTKPGPSAFLLSGEKRIAQACQMLWRNADTFVAHLEYHTALAGVEGCRHGDSAFPVRQRFHGVGQKIDDDLLQVLRISRQGRQSLCRPTCKRSVRFLTKWASKRSARSTASFNCKAV